MVQRVAVSNADLGSLRYDRGLPTIGASMIDPSNPAPIWVIWRYLTWLERISFLALCILFIYSLSSAATVLRLRSTTGVTEKLASIRKRLGNLKRATMAAFYFCGFVISASFQNAYSVSVLTKNPIGWIVLQDFQGRFAFAGNAFFLLLMIHLIQWFVTSRIDAFPIAINS